MRRRVFDTRVGRLQKTDALGKPRKVKFSKTSHAWKRLDCMACQMIPGKAACSKHHATGLHEIIAWRNSELNKTNARKVWRRE